MVMGPPVESTALPPGITTPELRAPLPVMLIPPPFEANTLVLFQK